MEERTKDRLLTKQDIADDLQVTTRHVDRLNIPGKVYLGPKSPRWWESVYVSEFKARLKAVG